MFMTKAIAVVLALGNLEFSRWVIYNLGSHEPTSLGSQEAILFWFSQDFLYFSLKVAHPGNLLCPNKPEDCHSSKNDRSSD